MPSCEQGAGQLFSAERQAGSMEEEAQSVRGRGWVKFDGEEETDSGKGNSESPGSLEVRARPVQCARKGLRR